MKKKLFSLLFLSAIISLGQAAPVKCLVVELSDATLLYFPLEQNPVATFNGNVMNLKNSSYSLSAIGKLYIASIDEDVVGINTIDTEENISIQDNGILRIKGSANEPSVYTLSGQAVPVTYSRSADTLLMDINALPKGCYILKSGSAAFKFFKH